MQLVRSVGIVAVLGATCGLLVGFVGGPATNTGQNPQKTFVFSTVLTPSYQLPVATAKKMVLEVPTGQVFVIKEVWKNGSASTGSPDYCYARACALVDGELRTCNWGGPDGVVAGSGSSVELYFEVACMDTQTINVKLQISGGINGHLMKN